MSNLIKLLFKNKFLFLILCCLALFYSSNLLADSSNINFSFEFFQTKNQTQIGICWIKPKPSWHTYSNEKGLSGFPTVIKVKLLPENKTLQSLYPVGVEKEDFLEPGIISKLYSENTPIFFEIPKFTTSSYLEINIKLLLCSNKSCLPFTQKLTVALPNINKILPRAETQPWWATFKNHNFTNTINQTEKIKTSKEVATKQNFNSILSNSQSTEDTKKASFQPRSFQNETEISTLGKAAALAILAGLLLNFMPCVLPIITLKLQSLIVSGVGELEERKKKFKQHNLFFALGIMLCFLGLATTISLTGMAWGQIFQRPKIVFALAMILFAMSLSLFGLYDLPIINIKSGQSSNKKHPKLEAIFAGFMATLLATPCSGPFLGGVLAWGLIQPPIIIFVILFSIGFGMALPFLILAFYPQFLRLLPRPGHWMIILEHLFGFLLLATCLYLISLLPPQMLFPSISLLWVVALAAWIWGKLATLRQTRLKRTSIRLLAVLIVLGSVIFFLNPTPKENIWQKFSFQKFESLLGKQNMILEFTADWCPNCKALEKTTLTASFLNKLNKTHDITFLRIDLTANDENLMDLLYNLGSRSIPFTAFFNTAEPFKPYVLRDIYSQKTLEKATNEAFSKSIAK